MILILAWGAVAAWAIGAIAMPIAAWIRLRAGGRRRAVVLVALVAGTVAQTAWLYATATGGLESVLEADAGLEGWGAWGLGGIGLMSLISGVTGGRSRGGRLLRDPDPAFEIALGLFGTGVLLQQIARALA